MNVPSLSERFDSPRAQAIEQAILQLRGGSEDNPTTANTKEWNNRRQVGGGRFASLQAAHDDLPTEGGVIELVEPISETGFEATKPVRIVGELGGDANEEIRVSVDTSGGDGLWFKNTFVLENLLITGDGTSAASSFKLKLGDVGQDVRGSVTRNLRVENGGGDGISFKGIHTWATYELISADHGGDGIVMDLEQDVSFITDCHFPTFVATDCGGHGCYMDTTGTSGDEARIQGNTFAEVALQRCEGWGLYQEDSSHVSGNEWSGYGIEVNSGGTMYLSPQPGEMSRFEFWNIDPDIPNGVTKVTDGTAIIHDKKRNTTTILGDHRQTGIAGKHFASASGRHGVQAMQAIVNGPEGATTYAGWQDNFLSHAPQRFSISNTGTVAFGSVDDAFSPDPSSVAALDGSDLPASVTIDFGTSINGVQVLGAAFKFGNYADVEIETDSGGGFTTQTTETFQSAGKAMEWHESAAINGVQRVRFTFTNANSTNVQFKLFANVAGAAPETWLSAGGGTMYGLLNFDSSRGSQGADSMTANPEADTEDGFVQVQLGGSTYQIPLYNP